MRKPHFQNTFSARNMAGNRCNSSNIITHLGVKRKTKSIEKTEFNYFTNT